MGTVSLLSRLSWSERRLWPAGIALLSIALAGCGKKPVHRRTGDAAPVEVITTPALPDGGVSGGAATEEVEPNDGDDVATALPLGGTVRGKIEPESDVDRYRIDVPAGGALSVMVSSLENLDAVLEIEDASGNVIARSDRGGPRIREGVPNLGVTPGDQLHIELIPLRKGRIFKMKGEIKVDGQVVSSAEFLAGLAEKSKIG